MIVLFLACALTVDPGGVVSSEADSGADSGLTDSVDTGPPPPPSACTAWGDPAQTGLVTDVTLNEISGVAPSVQNPGVLWVVEDHGNEPAVYAINELGELLATLTLGGTDNVDMEDLDLAPCGSTTCIVVADTGNNDRDRTDLALVVAEEPLLDGVTTDYRQKATRYGFTWPEAEDNEAITHTDDGRFVLASKRMDKVSAIATVPAYTEGAVATVIALVPTANEADADGGGAATSLSMWPDQHQLLVRTYQHSRAFSLAAGVDSVGTASFEDLVTPILPHDEGAAYDAVRRGYWTIPEAPIDGSSPVWWVPCVDDGR